MCGIAGIVAPRVERHQAALERMTRTLAHRGPDGSGLHLFADCGLGHRRLSIVDLSTGAQPMLSGRGDGITFNGEIYGYQALRSSLSDYPFRTSSDTEVILALHERHGGDFVSRLPGMFAFGLWDDRRRELLCARDRFGEKPFYYAFGPDGELLFASEIKALLASGLVRPILSRDAVAHYLKYLYVHPDQTIYRNVSTLPPGHLLRFRDGKLSVERYWSLPEGVEGVGPEEAVERFRSLFDQAVSRQLVADVPVGAFLSGGLDSSSVVAAAARHATGLKTFSFDFEDSKSELPFAREVAKRYGTRHTELADRDTDIGRLLVTMQAVYDEPFADSSNIPTYLLAKLAREHVKVVLTGDGGDELLAGYSYWYQPLLAMQRASGAKAGRRLWLELVLRVARRLGPRINPQLLYRHQGAEYARLFHSLGEAHARQQEYLSDADLRGLGLEPPRLPIRNNATGTVDDALRIDLAGYMPGDILVKIDRASMAHGLELRAPFLDVDFASFCISLPYRLKIEDGRDKLILRRAYSDDLPSSVKRRRKQGFGAPVAQWLARPSVTALREERLGNPGHALYSLLTLKPSDRLVQGNHYQAWTLLVLALWLDAHPCEIG